MVIRDDVIADLIATVADPDEWYKNACAVLAKDPAYRERAKWLRRTLDYLVPALLREGLDQAACDRAVGALLCGSPDPVGALEQVRFDEAFAQCLFQGEWAL